MSTVEKVALSSVRMRITEAESRDVGRGVVRFAPEDMEQLRLRVGDVVLLHGERDAVGKAMLGRKEARGRGRVQIDSLQRAAVGAGIDATIEVSKVQASEAAEVWLKPRRLAPHHRDREYIASLLEGLPVINGVTVRAPLFANDSLDFDVISTVPAGPVLIDSKTKINFEVSAQEQTVRAPAYEDVGGMRNQVQRIREMVELPLRYPEVFERLGVDAPRGVLLYGPPGCGKTLIARAIAQEASAKFFTISGPEIIHKHYGESEAHLRKIFEEASRQGPSIIFLDEIDAIAPRRENAAGDVERRVVAQLLTLMDGLKPRENTIVIAATNLPNSIDPALRRPGRFDREIEIGIPDRAGRLQILEIHTRGMPLSTDVNLDQLAAITHGFVGADLQALCREAAMSCLRALLSEIDFAEERIPYSTLAQLRVTMGDFQRAHQSVEPSAIREVFVEIPTVRWDDIGGLEPIKQQLREAITWPIKYQSLFEQADVKPERGILLAGPPGVGKTLLAKAAATECGVNFISIKGPELLSKFVGDAEKAVREIFSKARQAAPCIMFFDEIDGLCPARGTSAGDSGVAARVLAQVLSEMDGIEELTGVFVLGATNRADLIDPALRRFGRFERTIEIGLPDEAARQEILEVHVTRRPFSGEIDILGLARDTEGYTGADLASLCSSAARSAIRRCVQQMDVTGKGPPVAITIEDIENAKRAVRE